MTATFWLIALSGLMAGALLAGWLLDRIRPAEQAPPQVGEIAHLRAENAMLRRRLADTEGELRSSDPHLRAVR